MQTLCALETSKVALDKALVQNTPSRTAPPDNVIFVLPTFLSPYSS